MRQWMSMELKIEAVGTPDSLPDGILELSELPTVCRTEIWSCRVLPTA